MTLEDLIRGCKGLDGLEIQAMADYGNGWEPTDSKEDIVGYTVFGHRKGEGLVMDLFDADTIDKARFFAIILSTWIARETGEAVEIRDFSGEGE